MQRDFGRADVRLALVTEGMIHRSIGDLMDWLERHAPDVRDLEIGTGGYSPLGHSPLEMSQAERRSWLAGIRSRGFRIAAFNVSGNPLHPADEIGARHDSDLRRTIALAAELGVDRIVAMSGTPAAGPIPGTAPHFAANAWLPDYAGIADWQFEHRVRPYWEAINELIVRSGSELMVCLELHPGAHVFNVATFERLHAVAPRIGVNLDPSHLFWQRMDPLRVIERLGTSIGYAHAKDVRYHDDALVLNGLLDNRWPGDPATIPWDFAAVGYGTHDRAWWARFAIALERGTSASTLSIEHEDRLVPPEDGVATSATLLAGVLGPLDPGPSVDSA
ncbi:MAG: sugar phosphate isomerase/epimerase [Chloroflexota bacterium]|nr:MAG: sugar phosphate isomerase/epimerase [Chloroflexota bacterium]